MKCEHGNTVEFIITDEVVDDMAEMALEIAGCRQCAGVTLVFPENGVTVIPNDKKPHVFQEIQLF